MWRDFSSWVAKPSVTAVAEQHLLHPLSRIEPEKKIYLAEEYNLPNLMERCLQEMDCLIKIRKLHKSKYFEKLSDKTKVLILYCVILSYIIYV
ncbi:unnamed protein product [Caenorhabditis nigoni]